MNKPKEEIKVNCSYCKTNFKYYSSKYRPFCSERCKMIDMGNWFNGNYCVGGGSCFGSEETFEERVDENDKDE